MHADMHDCAEVDDRTLSFVDYALPQKLLRGEGSHVNPPIGDPVSDCALHLETSADWGQSVTVTLEFYAADEARSEPGPGWVLDGEGIFPRRSGDPLYVLSDGTDGCFFDIDIPGRRPPLRGVGRRSRTEPGRDRRAWEAFRLTPEGQSIPWEEASKTVPAGIERWLIRLMSN